MSPESESKWRCKDCYAVLTGIEFLVAPNPFDLTNTINGCPHCRQCTEGFEELCDDDTCLNIASAGWPTKDPNDKWNGYRRTCSLHAKEYWKTMEISDAL